MTRAAEALFVSQPAVSRRLALLEQDLGAPLFERVAGGVVLSEAGKTLLPLAERALSLLNDAEAAVRALHSADVGTVSITIGPRESSLNISNCSYLTSVMDKDGLNPHVAAVLLINSLCKRAEAVKNFPIL